MNRILTIPGSRQPRTLTPRPLAPPGNLIRVCADCEQEFGPVPLQPGQLKTHGFCRRHALDCLRSGGLSEQAIRDFERRWHNLEMPPDRALTNRHPSASPRTQPHGSTSTPVTARAAEHPCGSAP